MTLTIVRRVRGNLHGSIDISELEDKVIAHPIVQRLRRIKQTAFLSYVFPGASHSRFEHSLGVMNLAGRAWNKLEDNQSRLYHSSLSFPQFAEREARDEEAGAHGQLAPAFAMMNEVFASDYLLQALRLAALLHDVGHPPFSHSGERFLADLDEVCAANPELPPYLKAYLTSLKEKETHHTENKRKAVSHEIFTIILVDKLLNEVYRDYPELKLKVAAQDVIAIINQNIPPETDSPIKKLGVQQLCHELVSGEIDIDRMDYLKRDSRECGVVYGMFDLDRIMDSLGLYFDADTKLLHLAIQFSGLAAFEDYLRARQSMYIQLYFHKTSVACEAMLQALARILPDFTLPASCEDFIYCDETNWMSDFLKAGEGVLSGEKLMEFRRLVRDLFFDRKLWKRVYENTSLVSQSGGEDEMRLAKTTLDKAKIRYEQISPKNSLTKFRPRKKSEASINYLRLIKKDAKQFLRLVPIEDYSSLIRAESNVAIDRLYVDPKDAARAKELLMAVFSSDTGQ